jgi:hypothetical protein
MCWETSSLNWESVANCTGVHHFDQVLPKVEVVHRPLLISHVYVEREQIYRCQCLPAEHFEQGWQAVPVQVRLRRRGFHIGHAGFRAELTSSEDVVGDKLVVTLVSCSGALIQAPAILSGATINCLLLYPDRGGRYDCIVSSPR